MKKSVAPKQVKSPPQSWLQKHVTHLILLCIIFLGGVARFTQLAQLPATLNRDEAALAYNAYLLNKTGKDEWGKTWPVSLESFGDYKLPGYPLFLVASFKVLGATDYAVRFPSALAGTLLIGVGFWFARKVLNLQKATSLFVAASVALQPVFFFYSRMAWEANVALLFFSVAATLLLSRTLWKLMPWQVDLVAFAFCLIAIFTYNTPLLLLPFLGVSLIIQRGWKEWKQWLPTVVTLAGIFLFGLFVFSSISQQKSGITIFSDETTWLRSVQYYNSFSGIQQKVLGNRFVFFGKIIAQHVVDSVSPSFLVIRGGQHPWHTVPNTGHLYVLTYGLFVIGSLKLVLVVLQKDATLKSKLTALTLLFLLVTSLAPSVITVDSPHATRSLFFLLLATITSGIGFEWLWNIVSSDSKQRFGYRACLLIFIVLAGTRETSMYLNKYFTLYPVQSAVILKAGLTNQLIKMESEIGNKPDQVAVVDPDGFLYISAAWDLRMSPERFFSTINHHLPDRIGLKYGYRVGRYRFIAQPADRVPDDKHIIEWNSLIGRWMTDGVL